MEETLGELRRYLDSFPEDDSELAEIDAALAALHDVARKHRVPAHDLGAHLAGLEEELSSLAVNEARLAELEAGAAELEAKFLATAKSLSEARRSAASDLRKGGHRLLRRAWSRQGFPRRGLPGRRVRRRP